MISYCIACYRPRFAKELITELVNKTSVPYEILLWLNVEDIQFELFIAEELTKGIPLRIIGKTPENIGMVAYFDLFEAASYEMVTQIDDDVVCVTPHIAEIAAGIFEQFPDIGMLAADVWQDEYTDGARPPMQQYQLVDPGFGLYDGPVDGWFAIYRKSSLELCKYIDRVRYIFIGGNIQFMLRSLGKQALLCTHMKVFHVRGPQYCSYFGMLEFETRKFAELERNNLSQWYLDASSTLPDYEELNLRVESIRANLACAPAWDNAPKCAED